MEAAAEGAVGLTEARDGSPLSGAASSDDADAVVGVTYGMDAADMGNLTLTHEFVCSLNPHCCYFFLFSFSLYISTLFSLPALTSKDPTHLC